MLQFVSVGTVRHGHFEEARPWELLKGFEKSTAEQHYYSAADKALLEVLTSKSKSGAARLLTTDGAQVMLANFGDARASVPMHLNCAEASPVDVALLHDRLHRSFRANRDALVRDICDGEFVWPKDKPFKAYTPPVASAVPRWMERLADLAVVAVLGLLGWGLYWLLLR
ncbi:MAG: hypothetical protein ACLP7P_02340 [Rhodomicrobium sp.]